MNNDTDPTALATEMIREFDATSFDATLNAYARDIDDMIDSFIDDAHDDDDLYDAFDNDALLNATLRDRPALFNAIRAEITRRFNI